MDRVGEVRKFDGHHDEVFKVAFSTDGRHCLSADRSGEIYIWDLQSGTRVRRVLGKGYTTAVDLAPDGQRALRDDGDLRLVDLDTGQPLTRYEGAGFINAVAFLPDGRSAIYGHRDHTVRAIDLGNGHEFKRLEGLKRQADCLTCSPDGRLVIAGRFDDGNADDVVLIWDMATVGAPRRPERVMSMVACLAVSLDSRRALTGTMDTTVYQWELASGREIRRYDGHSGNVLCVAFSPNDKFLVSGSGTDAYDDYLLKELGIDNTVRLWDLESAGELLSFAGHERNVLSVAVSPDGRSILSGSADKTVRLWAVPESLAG